MMESNPRGKASGAARTLPDRPAEIPAPRSFTQDRVELRGTRNFHTETARNDYRLRFQDRLAYVDREFSTPSRGPGWSTLPGRMYLLLGPPTAVKFKYHGALAAGATRATKGEGRQAALATTRFLPCSLAS